MFSILSRFCVRQRLHSVLRYPIIKNYCSFNVNTYNVKASWSLLFSNRERYKMFEKNTGIVYEFDDETRKITNWQPAIASEQQLCTWHEPSNTYSDDELIVAFVNLLNFSAVNHIPLSDSRFNEFVDHFTERLQKFSLNQTMRALQHFVRHPMTSASIRQPNYIEILQAFDQACTIKSHEMLPDQVLFMSSIWIHIPFAKKTYLTQSMSRIFNRYMKTFTAYQMTQALYFVNYTGQFIENIRALENVLETNIDDLSIEELSSVLWTFTRHTSKIEKPELKQKFFAYLQQQDLNRLSDLNLATVLSNISKIHTTTKDAQKWEHIAKQLQSTLSRRSLKICILMGNVGLAIRYFEHDIISYIYRRCLDQPTEFSDLTMPDMEYLSRLLSMDNRTERNELQAIGHLLLNEIENRLDQVASRGFYAHLTNILRNLTVIDVYNLELMDNLFRPDYIGCIHKRAKQLDLPLYEIDGYNRINLKGIYTGNRLSDSHLDKLRYLINWVPDRQSRYSKIFEFTYAIEDAVQKLFTHYQYAHAVAHRKNASLIACIDRNTLSPVNISENFPPLYQGISIEAKTITNYDDNLIVFAFIATNIKEYSHDKRNKCMPIPLGYMAQKVKQLKMLGYHPILIPLHLWKQTDGQLAIENFIIDAINHHLDAMGIEKKFTNTQ